MLSSLSQCTCEAGAPPCLLDNGGNCGLGIGKREKGVRERLGYSCGWDVLFTSLYGKMMAGPDGVRSCSSSAPEVGRKGALLPACFGGLIGS